jgi:uncharacterized protein YceK
MRSVLLMLMVACSGCAEIATNMAVQGGIQLAGEQYLIANKKPITKCNLVNVAKGHKMCRIYRQYGRVE